MGKIFFLSGDYVDDSGTREDGDGSDTAANESDRERVIVAGSGAVDIVLRKYLHNSAYSAQFMAFPLCKLGL